MSGQEKGRCEECEKVKGDERTGEEEMRGCEKVKGDERNVRR